MEGRAVEKRLPTSGKVRGANSCCHLPSQRLGDSGRAGLAASSAALAHRARDGGRAGVGAGPRLLPH